jgi:succinate dehydrogenase / fumarate reductase membrane anchor subunit
MIEKSRITDPTTHYGTPKKATRHFITQRVTGALNIIFLLFLIWLVLSLASSEREQMIALVRNPLVGIPLALLIINVVIHMRIGMQEVIEDYFYNRMNRLTLLLNDIFCLFVAVLALGAIAKLMFWG